MPDVSAPSAPSTPSSAATTPNGAPTLVRAIGRWSLTAVAINTIVGSAIFGMPSTIAGHTGSWSPVVVLLAALGILPIVLSFAEVGSRFEGAGGPYLYARHVFGPAAGFGIGWLLLWTRVLTAGAILNVMVSYLTTLVPWVGTAPGRATTMIVAVTLVGVVNYRGVRQAAWTVNLFTVAKLLPLVVVALAGLLALDRTTLLSQQATSPSWTDAVLLLVFAYGGFEAAVITGSEMRRPREDTPFALLFSLLLVTVLYASVQLAIVGVLPNAAASQVPVADALRRTLGDGGAALASVGAVISTYGWLAGFGLLMPRIAYSMSERGELPQLFGRVHATFRTPHVAVVICCIIALGFGLYGSFAATATLSAIARLLVYGVTCAALIPLRRRSDAPPAGFIVPGGPVFAVFGILFTLWLLSTRSFTQAWMLGAMLLSGYALWAVQRRRGALVA